MNEERHSQYCTIYWSPVFWDEVTQRTIYTCVCVTKQFKQPTINTQRERTEVPQAFYDAFKTKEEKKWQP